MAKSCVICGSEIPEGRIKALPNAQTCTGCSTTDRKRGFQVVTGKDTYTELDIVDAKTYEKLMDQQNRKGSIKFNK